MIGFARRCHAAGTLVTCMIAAAPVRAQLIPPGQALPHRTAPPVIFLNGYQDNCGAALFSGTFGIADQVLQANGEVTVFFDNCTVAGSPSIEKLGAAFGDFLSSLKYEDGSAVAAVDVVAHSMGGLIVRSYLSGKQEQEGAFSPPAATHIRKAVFPATPHFGSVLAAFTLGFSTQLDELASGSHFVYDLGVWNDGTDDLRGVDALAVVGNGGTGAVSGQLGFDDGLVSLTSASLAFYLPGRTRIVPLCHIDGGGLGPACDSSRQGIAKIRSAGDDTARILVSFLNGGTDWQTVGQAAEQNAFLSTDGGLAVRPFDASGAPITLNSATATPAGGSARKLTMFNNQIAFTDLLPSGPAAISAAVAGGALSRTATVPAGVYLALPVKAGPNIARALPSAAAVFPLSFAPRTIVAIYGDALAQSTEKAHGRPLPTMLSDAQVTVNGSPLDLLYASPKQINAVLPAGLSGLVRLTIQNSAGASTVNLMIEAAHPAIFTLDGSGAGPAAAIDTRTGQRVSAANPLRAGDYVELFVTGLGDTTRRGGFDYANEAPVVTIGGADCPVKFAGAAPGFEGLDQINCKVPAGLGSNPAATLLVTSGARTSNVTTVAVE